MKLVWDPNRESLAAAFLVFAAVLTEASLGSSLEQLKYEKEAARE